LYCPYAFDYIADSVSSIWGTCQAVRKRIESTEPKQIGDIVKEAMGKNKEKINQ